MNLIRCTFCVGNKYKVGWSYTKLKVCTFTKVTDKGFAFIIDDDDKKRIHKGLYYPWKKSKALTFLLPDNMIILNIK